MKTSTLDTRNFGRNTLQKSAAQVAKEARDLYGTTKAGEIAQANFLRSMSIPHNSFGANSVGAAADPNSDESKLAAIKSVVNKVKKISSENISLESKLTDLGITTSDVNLGDFSDYLVMEGYEYDNQLLHVKSFDQLTVQDLINCLTSY